jgi:cytochrome c-type biogenesis protein CcmF
MTGSSALKTDFKTTLRPGEAVEVREYTVRFDRLDAFDEPHRFVVGANLTVFIDGREAGTLFPRLNYYTSRAGEAPITTPGVRSRADNDLYVNLLAFAQDGSTATLDVIVEPLVVWIWIGSFIVAFGALITMWPRRRRTAFTAVPHEEAFAAAEAA